ncbi:FKBP-type peptidyl-prolyl cis-trans isomerase [Algoriphagus zhangzhouensis]|uniref:Peptidyl-prolyl cis-trans isomerase n=1 Tax=Algoriphagus zhangzhouensis TaxID=1073327 RepID=A0A1M7ZJN0_9BACT|nr:FKBP-type peptidyl-prolyl cis-trans isomerase [Algoriphagus zhangzhouensis]TDY43552.1 FKBP-type peptidyl-prolyl cis-trans isomerase SlyD [Algoriphagus zhangzhouensis]SHO65022.1 FKBP-type peptidyl-prolyl cis-trans isomerase SlyD [Algoriphagus zhangzhouensis]
MKIQENAVVGLTYELKVSKIEDDIESVPFEAEVRDEDDPFYFLFGNSGLPEKFEELMAGKSVGDTFSFVLKVEEAYGEADDELLVSLPKSQFSKENGFNPEMLQEGNFLPLMDEDGYSMQAKVLKDLGENVLLDFNHPLVGFDLHFDGKVIEVREATQEEMEHGHVHGEHGAHE